jgi:probable HAF family extracellular repeat protein
MTQIGTAWGQAQGINNLDQVVGAHVGHAFLWEDGSMIDLGTIGTANSDAKAINENGQVVGQLTFPGGVEHAMFWQDGEIFNLNDLISSDSDFVLTNAYDINNKGQIVGHGTINGEGHAFLLTPISDVNIDIIPKACPNECPIKGGSAVEVAILGTLDFDVNDIDIASVRLEGVAPTRSSLKDKSTPLVTFPTDCECTSDGKDGEIDLCLKFDKKAIISALGGVNVDQEYPLTLSGSLNDGTPIEGQDCIVFVKKGKKD